MKISIVEWFVQITPNPGKKVPPLSLKARDFPLSKFFQSWKSSHLKTEGAIINLKCGARQQHLKLIVPLILWHYLHYWLLNATIFNRSSSFSYVKNAQNGHLYVFFFNRNQQLKIQIVAFGPSKCQPWAAFQDSRSFGSCLHESEFRLIIRRLVSIKCDGFEWGNL